MATSESTLRGLKLATTLVKTSEKNRDLAMCSRSTGRKLETAGNVLSMNWTETREGQLHSARTNGCSVVNTRQDIAIRWNIRLGAPHPAGKRRTRRWCWRRRESARSPRRRSRRRLLGRKFTFGCASQGCPGNKRERAACDGRAEVKF